MIKDKEIFNLIEKKITDKVDWTNASENFVSNQVMK